MAFHTEREWEVRWDEMPVSRALGTLPGAASSDRTKNLAEVFLGLFALLLLALLLLAFFLLGLILGECHGDAADGQRHTEHESHQFFHSGSPFFNTTLASFFAL